MSGYIAPESWPRKPLSDFFGRCDYPFYSLCCRVEAGALYRRAKAEGLSFYACMIHAVMSALNGTEAFLYKLREDGVYRHDFLSPSFTDAAENGLLKIVNVDWRPGEPMKDFALRVRAAADAQRALVPDEESEARDDFAYLSCLPWLDFSALSNERSFDKNDSIPRLSWGRLRPEADGASLPLSIDVNHRLIDGQHIGAFFSALSSFTSR
ncbi:MAG: CatA-like O-acetyltransferase [Clostridia bacterium]|nr:CatA-like O-acetyltransferase [Clostridia bacterium]